MSLRALAVFSALLTLDAVAVAQTARPRIDLLNTTGRLGPDSVGVTNVVAAHQVGVGETGFFINVIKGRGGGMVGSDFLRVDVAPRASSTLFTNLPLDYFGIQSVTGSLNAQVISSTGRTSGAPITLNALTRGALFPELGPAPLNVPTFACDLGGECLMARSRAPSAGMAVQRFVPDVINTLAAAPVETVNATAQPDPASFDADFLSGSAIVVWSEVVAGISRVFGQWIRPRPSTTSAPPIVLGFGRAPRVACLPTFGVCIIAYVRDNALAAYATTVNETGTATATVTPLQPTQKLFGVDLSPITNGVRIAGLVQFGSNAYALAAVDFIGSMGAFISTDTAVVLPTGEPRDLRLSTRLGENVSLATWVGEGPAAVASGALILPAPFADGGVDSGPDASDANSDAEAGRPPLEDAGDERDATVSDTHDASIAPPDSASAPQMLYTGGACNCRVGFVRPSSAQFTVVALVSALCAARRSRRRGARVARNHCSNRAGTPPTHSDHRER
jgi:hypothetical protein